jgi:hypothetical protein
LKSQIQTYPKSHNSNSNSKLLILIITPIEFFRIQTSNLRKINNFREFDWKEWKDESNDICESRDQFSTSQGGDLATSIEAPSFPFSMRTKQWSMGKAWLDGASLNAHLKQFSDDLTMRSMMAKETYSRDHGIPYWLTQLFASN